MAKGSSLVIKTSAVVPLPEMVNPSSVHSWKRMVISRVTLFLECSGLVTMCIHAGGNTDV